MRQRNLAEEMTGVKSSVERTTAIIEELKEKCLLEHFFNPKISTLDIKVIIRTQN